MMAADANASPPHARADRLSGGVQVSQRRFSFFRLGDATAVARKGRRMLCWVNVAPIVVLASLSVPSRLL